jgi:hypothetical protein
MREEGEGSSKKRNKCIGRTRASSNSARPCRECTALMTTCVETDAELKHTYLYTVCATIHPSIIESVIVMRYPTTTTQLRCAGSTDK